MPALPSDSLQASLSCRLDLRPESGWVLPFLFNEHEFQCTNFLDFTDKSCLRVSIYFSVV